ncbi:alpha/beta fold hydrolase [Sedimentitalea sp. XS_ASV28]|uniref:alpha/beta fold hydrolase n=1 Tax=Sedimentitalea sp. XS_ASV28 TaxID=3241296 RepID=UPI0035151CEF
MGSFHIGGRMVELRDAPVEMLRLTKTGRPAPFDPNGHYHIGQMYVQYFLQQSPTRDHPLLFWHGGGLTGACWETTPDGRPGWRELFLQFGWDVYVSDAVERGRSGFAPVPRLWPAPVTQTLETVFERFRIGQARAEGGPDDFAAQAYADSNFPVEALAAFGAQMVPRWIHTDELILDAYEALLRRVDGATVIAHSQGGYFALEAAARHPDLIRSLVLLEPAAIPDSIADMEDFATPTLILLGDHIDGNARWTAMREDIRSRAECHSCVEIRRLPSEGLHGNSHMLMMDRNNADIARLVDRWLTHRFR